MPTDAMTTAMTLVTLRLSIERDAALRRSVERDAASRRAREGGGRDRRPMKWRRVCGQARVRLCWTRVARDVRATNASESAGALRAHLATFKPEKGMEDHQRVWEDQYCIVQYNTIKKKIQSRTRATLGFHTVSHIKVGSERTILSAVYRSDQISRIYVNNFDAKSLTLFR